MRRAGRQTAVQALFLALLLCACRTAPRPGGAREPGAPDGETPETFSAPGPPQAGSVIAEVSGTQVLALAAPQFAQLPRDQRLLAYWAAQAAAAGQPVAL